MTLEQLHTDDGEHDVVPSPPAPPPAPVEPTLGALVNSLARRTPDALLGACAIVGLVGSGALALLAPSWWRTIPPLVLLSNFGLWGMVDRERDATGVRGIGVMVARAVIILASFAAVGVVILSFLGVAIGTWIS